MEAVSCGQLLTAYGGVLALPPKAVTHHARRAQIPFIINNL